MTASRAQRLCRCGRKFTPPVNNPKRVNCLTCRPPQASNGGGPAPQPIHDVAETVPDPRPAGQIEAAAAAELVRCKREHTYLGAVAVRLARVMDDPALSEARLSALAAQLERTMEKATAGAEAAKDALDTRQDEIAAKMRAVS